MFLAAISATFNITSMHLFQDLD